MSNIKPKGYWLNVDNVVSEARKAMEEQDWDVLPRGSELQKGGYSSLVAGVTRSGLGMHKLRKILGQEQKRVVYGSWKSLDYAIERAREIMQKEGWTNLPGYKTLREKGYQGLDNAITVHHGGYVNFRNLLGSKQMKGRWADLAFTISEAERIMGEEGWTELPSRSDLTKKGHRGLIAALFRYHGGLENVRKLLKKKSGGKSDSERLRSVLESYVSGDNPHE